MGILDFLQNFFQKPAQPPVTPPSSPKDVTSPSVPKDTDITSKKTGQQPPKDINLGIPTKSDTSLATLGAPSYTIPQTPPSTEKTTQKTTSTTTKKTTPKTTSTTTKEQPGKLSPELKKAHSELDKLPDDFTVGDLANFLNSTPAVLEDKTAIPKGIEWLTKGATTFMQGVGWISRQVFWMGEDAIRAILKLALTGTKYGAKQLYKEELEKGGIKDFQLEISTLPAKEFLKKSFVFEPVADLIRTHPIKDIPTEIQEKIPQVERWGEQLMQSGIASLEGWGWFMRRFPALSSAIIVGGGLTLDLTPPVGGGEKNLFKVMTKIKDEKLAADFLMKHRVPEIIALKHAKSVVEAKKIKDAAKVWLDIMEDMKRFMAAPLAKIAIQAKDFEDFRNLIFASGKDEEAMNIIKLLGYSNIGEFYNTVRPLKTIQTEIKGLAAGAEKALKGLPLPSEEALKETATKAKSSEEFISGRMGWEEWLKKAPKKEVVEEAVQGAKTPPPEGGIPGGGEPPPGRFGIPEFGTDDFQKKVIETVKKFQEAFGKVKLEKRWKEIGEEYTKEMAQKVAVAKKELYREDIKKATEAFRRATAKMAGSLQTEKVQELKTVELPGITEEDVEILAEAIRHSTQDFFTKWHAWEVLENLGKGHAPQPARLRDIQVILAEYVGREGAESFVKNVLSKIPLTLTEKLWLHFRTVANEAARTLEAMGDASAVLRQGEFYTWNLPRQAFRSLVETTKAVIGEARGKPFYEAMMKEIENHPMYNLAREFGVFFSEPHLISGPTEEMFATKLIEILPLIGQPLSKTVKLSEYHFSGFLNWLRFDLFKDGADTLMKLGFYPHTHPELYYQLAEAVNIFSGRASLGALSSAGPVLNLVLFAPRFTLSNLQLINPAYYASLHPAVRKWVLMKVLRATLFRWTFKILIGSLGAKVFGPHVIRLEKDPRSSDFGKIVLFDTIRINPDRGLDQQAVVLSRIATLQRKDLATGEIYPIVPEAKSGSYEERLIRRIRGSVIEMARWIEKKYGPLARYIVDFSRGRTFTGEPLTFKNILWDRYVPFVVQDIRDVLESGALQPGFTLPISLLAGTASFFGATVQAFKPKPRGGTAVIGGLGTTGVTPSEADMQKYMQNLEEEMQNYMKDLNEMASKWGNFMLPGFEEYLQPYNPKTGEFYVWPPKELIDEIMKNPQNWKSKK